MEDPHTVDKAFFCFILILCFGCERFSPKESQSDHQKLMTINSIVGKLSEKFPQVKSFSPEEAQDLFAQGKIVFVDVRSNEERSVSSLPDAISLNDFQKHQTKGTDVIYVFYCDLGHRSAALVQKYQKQNISVGLLSGGIQNWVHHKGQVFNEHKAVKKIHIYAPKWDLLPADYEKVF